MQKHYVYKNEIILLYLHGMIYIYIQENLKKVNLLSFLKQFKAD